MKVMFRSLSQLLMQFDHPATVENLGVAPQPAPEVDYAEFGRHIDEEMRAGAIAAERRERERARLSGRSTRTSE